MRVFFLIGLCLLLPGFLFAQSGTISGKVLRMDTKTPLAKVSIFLSNSSFGTVSAEDGSFSLAGLKPGQYELVASSVGFDEFNQTIMVGKDPITLNIEMLPKVTQLHDVVITTNADWKKNYALFEKDFIGTSANARLCKVVNPHDVTLIYHGRKQTLEAWTDDFLVVENHALGYRVKFLIKDFSDDEIERIIQWEGKVLFEDLPGNAEQKKKWKEARELCYYGSAKHFLRDLYTNKFTEDGFIMYKLKRTLNPERPQEVEIQKNLKKFRNTVHRDSFNYWVDKETIPRYRENLIRTPLTLGDVFQQTNKQGIFSLAFSDHLYVVYTKRHEETYIRDFYRPLDMENFEASIITLYEPYALFDMNGIVVNGKATLFEGTWSKAKLAEMLPVDYVPGD